MAPGCNGCTTPRHTKASNSCQILQSAIFGIAELSTKYMKIVLLNLALYGMQEVRLIVSTLK